MIYADTLGRRRARRRSSWFGWVAVTTPLAAQDVDPAAYEHLVERRIVERADERVLEVRAVGDPDEYRTMLRYGVRPAPSGRAPAVLPSTAPPAAEGSR